MTGQSSSASHRGSGGAGWLPGLIFVCLATGIVAAGYFYYRNYQQNYRSEVERQLSAVADLKVGEVVQWRKERLADGAVFFKNGSFSGFVRRFVENPEDTQAQQQIQTWVEKYQTANQYDQVRLLDAQGVTRLSVPAGLPAVSSSIAKSVSEALRSGQVALEDFYRDDNDPEAHLAVLAPILDESDASRPLGVLLLRIDPKAYLYPFIQHWPTTSPTAETLLVRRDGNEVVYLNELRFQSTPALTVRRPLDQEALPAARAALGQEGVMEGVDYRGGPVVAALRTIRDSPWFLVARMDAVEMYAPLRERLWQMVVLIGALLLSAGAGIVLLWRQQSVRFYRERAAAAETIRETNEYLENLFNYANAPIIVWDLRFKITRFNHAFESLTGRKAGEVIGQSLELLFPPALVDSSMALIQKTTGGERWETVEISILHRDGSVRIVLWNSATVYAADGKTPVATIAQGHDITEHKQADEALRESESRFRQLAESLPQLVWTCQPDGACDYLNRQWIEFTGVPKARQHGFGWLEQLHPDDRAPTVAAWEAAVASGSDFRVEFRIRRHDGEYRWFDTQAVRLRDAAGRTVKWFGANTDMTERKRVEEEIRLLNTGLEQRVHERTAQLETANKELEAFSYSVSHDLRAPLRHVQGYVDMLAHEAEGQLSATSQRYMKIITDASREMGVLIDDLLAFSRMGRAEMIETKVDLSVLVREILRGMEPATRERNIVWKIPPLPVVQADPAMLKLAFANLLGNAVKFTRPRDPAQIEIGCAGREGERAIFFVRDNGVGFDPQYAHKLFGVFQRLHRADEFEGTGIGLANVQRIIARHGGRTWAEGKPNEGATFYFTLKASK
jgi:PAS domain S-box-containing protein